MTRPPFKLLIDECLSPALATYARERGFVAEHVNDVKRKRKNQQLTDRQVANYAIERAMIVVTNNMVDFEQIYVARKVHPGLIFLSCSVDGLFTAENQATMLSQALAMIEESEPVQEAIQVVLRGELGKDELDIETSRHELPAHATA